MVVSLSYATPIKPQKEAPILASVCLRLFPLLFSGNFFASSCSVLLQLLLLLPARRSRRRRRLIYMTKAASSSLPACPSDDDDDDDDHLLCVPFLFACQPASQRARAEKKRTPVMMSLLSDASLDYPQP